MNVMVVKILKKIFLRLMSEFNPLQKYNTAERVLSLN